MLSNRCGVADSASQTRATIGVAMILAFVPLESDIPTTEKRFGADTRKEEES